MFDLPPLQFQSPPRQKTHSSSEEELGDAGEEKADIADDGEEFDDGEDLSQLDREKVVRQLCCDVQDGLHGECRALVLSGQPRADGVSGSCYASLPSAGRSKPAW